MSTAKERSKPTGKVKSQTTTTHANGKVLATVGRHPATGTGHTPPATPANPAPTTLMNPSTLPLPSYLMCLPFSLSADAAINIWMEEYAPEERSINRKKALQQFLALYHFVASHGLVYLLPAPTDCGLQDVAFTANIGFVPEHLPGRDTVIISNFTHQERQGESEVAEKFFSAMGYKTVRTPYRFEGDAEIKHLHDNIYVGGYGERSDRQAYTWMEKNYDMKVIAVEGANPYLYHLDCIVFPIDRENTAVCTEALTRKEVAAIEKHTNILPVSLEDSMSGLCNSVRVHNMIVGHSDLHDLKAGTEDYKLEIQKNRRLEDIAVQTCCEIVFFNLSEFYKSGALLSCLLMHLNRFSYDVKLF